MIVCSRTYLAVPNSSCSYMRYGGALVIRLIELKYGKSRCRSVGRSFDQAVVSGLYICCCPSTSFSVSVSASDECRGQTRSRDVERNKSNISYHTTPHHTTPHHTKHHTTCLAHHNKTHYNTPLKHPIPHSMTIHSSEGQPSIAQPQKLPQYQSI
jgi:hypothetical protein